MLDYLPGTSIESSVDHCSEVLGALFSGGGLVLSQVSKLTELEPHTIQNWVKRGFITSPTSKKYSRDQFCRIAIIGMLKDCLQIDRILELLTHINGNLDPSSENYISDNSLYLYFCSVVSLSKGELSAIGKHITKAVRGFSEKLPGMKKRLSDILEIMAIAYISSYLKHQAEIKISALDNTIKPE